MHTRPKTHVQYRAWDAHACEIDARLEPQEGDFVIYKENASAFFGTHLASHLIEEPVDTFGELISAAQSSLDFWGHPFDDEDWNNA